MSELGHGTVLIREHFWVGPDGREYIGVTGEVETAPAEQLLGFEPNHRDSNWIVYVTAGDNRVTIPGCAVLGFHAHPAGAAVGPAYLDLAAGDDAGAQLVALNGHQGAR